MIVHADIYVLPNLFLQLIWIYTVCKGRVYPGSAGQGLTLSMYGHIQQMTNWWYFSYFSKKIVWQNSAIFFPAH